MSMFPKNYVTLNDLRERYMKEKEREKAEAEAKAAAENAVVVPVTDVVEEPTSKETNVGEKAKTEEVRSIGNDEGKERDSVRWSERWSRFRRSGNEIMEGSKRREKADVFGGRNKRSDKVLGRQNERNDWNRQETDEVYGTNNGDGWRNRRPNVKKSGTEDIGNRKTEERRNVEKSGTEDIGNRKTEERQNVEKSGTEDIGNRKMGESRRNWQNKKNDETLVAEMTVVEKVLETEREKNVGFGNRVEEGGNEDEKTKRKIYKKKRKGKGKGKETVGEKTEEDEKLLVAMGCVDEEKETVVVNGRVWVKKVTWVLVGESAEIKTGFRMENRVEGLSVVVEKGGNVEGDGNVDNGRRIGKGLKSGSGDSIGEIGKENVRGEQNRKSGNGRTGNRKSGKQGSRVLDTSLVWVRKEEKSDVCVAGNCREGVMAKAGEREKRPGRGRP